LEARLRRLWVFGQEQSRVLQVVLLAVLSVVRVHWLNGANFGDGLGAGFKAGIIGGVAGGLINGISSGILAVGDNRTFWSGQKWNEITIGSSGDNNILRETGEFLRDWDVNESMDITNASQNGNECLVGCKRGIDKFFGVEGQNEINAKWSNISIKGSGLSEQQGYNMFREGGYKANLFNKSFSKEDVLSFISGEMKQTRSVIINARTTDVLGYHANVVRSVKYLSDFSRFQISTMNPIGGGFINVRNFSSYNNMFSL